MEQRVALGREAGLTRAAVVDTCPGRHCWVMDAADRSGQRRPGLLVEWRRAGGEWEGLVIYVAQVRPGSWATVQEWMPASLVVRDDGDH